MINKKIVYAIILLAMLIGAGCAPTAKDLGIKAHEKGDYLTAIKQFEKALRENPSDADMQNRLLVSQKAQEKHWEDQAYNNWHQNDLDQALYFYKLAYSVRHNDKYLINIESVNEKIAYLEKVTKKIREMLSEDYDQAVAIFETIEKEYSQTTKVEITKRLLEQFTRSPAYARQLIRKSRDYYNKHNLVKALELCRQALSIKNDPKYIAAIAKIETEIEHIKTKVINITELAKSNLPEAKQQYAVIAPYGVYIEEVNDAAKFISQREGNLKRQKELRDEAAKLYAKDELKKAREACLCAYNIEQNTIHLDRANQIGDEIKRIEDMALSIAGVIPNNLTKAKKQFKKISKYTGCIYQVTNTHNLILKQEASIKIKKLLQLALLQAEAGKHKEADKYLRRAFNKSRSTQDVLNSQIVEAQYRIMLRKAISENSTGQIEEYASQILTKSPEDKEALKARNLVNELKIRDYMAKVDKITVDKNLLPVSKMLQAAKMYCKAAALDDSEKAGHKENCKILKKNAHDKLVQKASRITQKTNGKGVEALIAFLYSAAAGIYAQNADAAQNAELWTKRARERFKDNQFRIDISHSDTSDEHIYELHNLLQNIASDIMNNYSSQRGHPISVDIDVVQAVSGPGRKTSVNYVNSVRADVEHNVLNPEYQRVLDKLNRAVEQSQSQQAENQRLRSSRDKTKKFLAALSTSANTMQIMHLRSTLNRTPQYIDVVHKTPYRFEVYDLEYSLHTKIVVTAKSEDTGMQQQCSVDKFTRQTTVGTSHVDARDANGHQERIHDPIDFDKLLQPIEDPLKQCIRKAIDGAISKCQSAIKRQYRSYQALHDIDGDVMPNHDFVNELNDSIKSVFRKHIEADYALLYQYIK